MAFDIRSVTSLVLEGEDNASAAFDAVGESAGGLTGSLSSLAVGGTAVAGAALLAAAGVAFQFSQAVDTAMNTVEAQTGLTGDALADFEEQAKDVFENNWGENFGDVADAMSTVQRITQTAGDELESLTEKGLIVRDTFGADVTESVRAVNTAMENFGTDGERAFDLVTAAFQRTGDPAGDLLDTINEYSADFAEAGFSADQMFNTLVSGADAGVFNLDKVGDTVREFSTRLIDGSETSRDALDALGIGADEMYERFASGSVTTQEAMSEVGAALASIADPIERDAAGVALFGSLWEDLGEKAILGIADATDALGDVEGATDKAGDALSKGLMPALSSIWRQVQLALEPIGDAIGDVLMMALPYIEMFVGWFTDALPGAIAAIMTPIDGLGGVVSILVESFKALFEGDMDAFGEGISQAFSGVQSVLGLTGDAANGVFDALSIGWTTTGEVLRGIWDGVIAPIFASLKGTVEEDVLPAVGRLADWIGSWLPDAMQTARGIVTDQLLPAITTMAGFIADTVIPTIGTLVAWLLDNIPVAAQAAADFFNNHLEPAFRTIWEAIQVNVIPLLIELGDWLEVFIPQAVEFAREAWEEVLEPALRIVWEFITEDLIPAITDVVVWVIEKIPEAVEKAREAWEEVLEPALRIVWEFITEDLVPAITTMWEWISDKVPTALQDAADAFKRQWDAMKQSVAEAWDPIDEIFTKIKEFFNWLTGAIFSFNFEWPELPEWMQHGSPIKLHSLMMDWHEWLNQNEFSMRTDWGDQPGLITQSPGSREWTQLAAQQGTVINFNAPITISDRQTGDAFMEFLRLRQDTAALEAFTG